VSLLPASCEFPKPLNEFQIRPFLKLEPEEFPRAWETAVSRTKDGRPTPKVVRAVIGELSGREQPSAVKNRNWKGIKARRNLPLGHLLALLTEARRAVEKHDTERVLAALDGIENLLFDPRRDVRKSNLTARQR